MRRVGSLVGLIAMIGALAACGGAETDPTTTTAEVTKTSPAKGSTTTPAVATTTTLPSPSEVAAGSVYRGQVTVTDAVEEFLTILDSSVEGVDEDGTFSIRIDMTFEAIWVAGDDNNEPCVSTDRWVLSGSGPSAPDLELDLLLDAIEMLAISGCERVDDDDDDGPIQFVGTLADESVMGTFWNDVLAVTAIRS